MTVLAVTAVGLTAVVTGAYLTAGAAITGNTFTAGRVDLNATPTTSAITMAGMAPGDKVTAPITVSNAGNLPLRYAVSSVTTEDVLAAELELTIKTGVTTCSNAAFGADGAAAGYSAGDLGSVAGTKILGDSAQGPQPGDRDLAAGASEVLCAQVVLPTTSATTSQGITTTAIFTFNAEYDPGDPVLAGSLVGTTVPASWTSVPGATSYSLARVATTPGIAAQLNAPAGVAVAADGTAYVADTGNHRIRKVTTAGVVTTLAGSTSGFADGTGGAAKFNSPYGVAVGVDGTVYVADSGNNRIRKVTASGVVTTLAGSGTYGSADGIGTAAQFASAYGVAVGVDGTVYVVDSGTCRLRKITAAGVVTTLAGSSFGFADGTGAAAKFASPYGVAVGVDGTLYVSDYFNNRIRKVTAAGDVSTLAGSTSGFADGTGAAAKFNSPWGVAVAAAGTVYVADSNNHRIRKVTAAGVVTTLAGTGTLGSADTGPPVVVPSGVYTGAALSFTDVGLLVGTSYTYTVTAVGPGTTSNTIGPFAP